MGRVITSPRSVVRQGPRRKMAWSDFQSGTVFTPLLPGTAVLSNIGSPTVAEQTIIRTRGILSIMSDQQAANETQIGALGIGVVQEQAASIGVIAVSHPIADSLSGLWFTWVPFAQSFLFITAAGVDCQRQTNYEIDSKAMRKLGANERLVFVVENQSAIHGLQFWFTIRMLSKLP